MRNSYEFTTVCALDQVGDRFYIYDLYHHADGRVCRDEITVDEFQYRVTTCPADGTAEESGEKLPRLTLEDLQSYFTGKPSEELQLVLEKAAVTDIPFAQLVLVELKEAASDIYQAESFNVTGEGTHHRHYDPLDLVGVDTWDMQQHVIDDAWYCYHHKPGHPEDD